VSIENECCIPNTSTTPLQYQFDVTNLSGVPVKHFAIVNTNPPRSISPPSGVFVPKLLPHSTATIKLTMSTSSIEFDLVLEDENHNEICRIHVCSPCAYNRSSGDDPGCSVEIPTVSEWGLVILTLLLLAGAKIYFGLRRTVTA